MSRYDENVKADDLRWEAIEAEMADREEWLAENYGDADLRADEREWELAVIGR